MWRNWNWPILCWALVISASSGLPPHLAKAQPPAPVSAAPAGGAQAEERFNAAMESAGTTSTEASGPATAERTSTQRVNLLQMFIKGGLFMWPILALSILTVILGVERGLALRQAHLLPTPLVQGLGGLSESPDVFDPKAAYRLCQKYPSTAANVVRAMLLKSGRPLPEIEAAATQAAQRDADQVTGGARWIALFANMAMQLGLLGTVQGMIMAFFQMANVTGLVTNRATEFADGIYTALVTTFAGLVVAIPGFLIAHMLDERAAKLFRMLDELIATLLPHFERFEGRLKSSAARTAEARGGDAAEQRTTGAVAGAVAGSATSAAARGAAGPITHAGAQPTVGHGGPSSTLAAGVPAATAMEALRTTGHPTGSAGNVARKGGAS